VATTNDCAMNRSYKHILKNVPLFMLVNILGYDFPVFLDTGSPLSFLGNELVDVLKER